MSKPKYTAIVGKVKWTNNKGKVEKLPDKVMYAYTRMVLDTTLPTVPMGFGYIGSGTLRRTTMNAGVQKVFGGYKIGSYTEYAAAVYAYKNVHWTTTGTHGEWFERTVKEKGNMLMNEAVARYKL